MKTLLVAGVVALVAAVAPARGRAEQLNKVVVSYKSPWDFKSRATIVVRGTPQDLRALLAASGARIGKPGLDKASIRRSWVWRDSESVLRIRGDSDDVEKVVDAAGRLPAASDLVTRVRDRR
jgi:hypothetical protein